MKKNLICLFFLLLYCNSFIACNGKETVVKKNNQVVSKQVIKEQEVTNKTKTNIDEGVEILDFDIVKSMIGFYKSGDLKVENTFSIAILDTGIYPHKDLIYPQNRIIYSVDLVNNRLDTYDDNGHGTAMSGIIGANNENGNNGIAPFVNFVSVKVLDYQCKGYRKTVAEGIEWVIKNKDKYNIKIINLSVGIPTHGTDDIVSVAARKAYESGIVVVASAGNVEQNVQMFTPANEESVIAVGSISNTSFLIDYKYTISDFTVRWKTNTVNKPDIYAPGCNILTLKSDIYYKGVGKPDKTDDYYTVTGTSASSAIVSGVVAVYMNMYPDKTIDEIKEVLYEDSILIHDDLNNTDFKFIQMKGNN